MPRVAKPPKPKICPFVVVRDSREQSPFPFQTIEGFDVIQTVTAALPTGDYSILGMESRISIERKSCSDFYGSIGSDRERFEREMVRLAAMEYAAVVIEGDWRELLVDRPETIQMSAKSASHTIFAWSIRYGVHFFPMPGRRAAELATFALLRHFWKQDQERLKTLAKLNEPLLMPVDDDWIESAIDSL